MKNFLRCLLALLLAFALANSAFAASSAKKQEISNESDQTNLLSDLVETFSEELTYSAAETNFDFTLVEDQNGQIVLVDVYCNVAKSIDVSYTVAAEKEFGAIIEVIKIYKEKCKQDTRS